MPRVKSVVSVILCMLLTACGESPTEGALHLSFVGSDRGLTLAQEAADEWGAACGRTMIVLDGGRPLEEVSIVDPANPSVGGLTGRRKSDKSLVWIRVCPDHDPDVRRSIIAHELGHALGFEHYAHPGIMNQWPDNDAHVVPADCIEVDLLFTGTL